VESPGTLYLIPTPIGSSAGRLSTLPASVRDLAASLDGVIAESRVSGQRFLREVRKEKLHREIPIRLLNEHTRPGELDALIDPVCQGGKWGLMSDAGCPAVADPGAALVRLAHQRGIRVSPQVGPSSVLLALMASGLNGQSFIFHGYLPRDAARRREHLRRMESEGRRLGQTQIWMETPYRNAAMFEDALTVLNPATVLCVAMDLTDPTEEIGSRAISEWRKREGIQTFGRRPAIFLIGAGAGRGRP